MRHSPFTRKFSKDTFANDTLSKMAICVQEKLYIVGRAVIHRETAIKIKLS